MPIFLTGHGSINAIMTSRLKNLSIVARYWGDGDIKVSRILAYNDNAANFSSGNHYSSHLVAYWPVCFEQNSLSINVDDKYHKCLN